MPLLQEEMSVFPSDVFLRPFAATEQRWWVLHTRPRSEKLLARQLRARETSFFLPQYKRSWRYRGRHLTSYVPTFPGYIFLFGDQQARIQALETNLVVNTLVVGDQQELFEDLQRVHQLIESGQPLTPEERLQPGNAVEVMSGPFAGMEGKILQRNKTRFMIEVRLLQQGVSVDIEAWMIRPLGRKAMSHAIR